MGSNSWPNSPAIAMVDVANLPSTLGQKLMAGSLAVTIASDQSPLAVSQSGAWTVGLPAGASTSANQLTEITALGTINTTLGSPFQAGGSIGNTTFASTQSGVWNLNNISGTISLPTGAATSALQTSGAQKTQVVDGSGNVIGSTSNALNTFLTNATIAVTESGDFSVNDNGFSSVNPPVYNPYSTTPVTTSAYVQLVASLIGETQEIEIFDSSGQALYLATGASGSEVNQIIIYPGGNGRIKLNIASGARVSVKALTSNATSGFLTISFYG